MVICLGYFLGFPEPPSDVRFLMVDGTGGELSLYPKDAANDEGDLGGFICAHWV